MPTDKETIQSYDDYAAEWSKGARTNKRPSHTFLEKPAMFGKLPDLRGKAVLCVGCGSGEECAEMKKLGAERVVGIDISKGLIEQAKHNFPDVEFLVMDMEAINFPMNTFDFVYSSLALHYVQYWKNIFVSIRNCLKPNGKFLFSTHHPVYWSAATGKTGADITRNLGYKFNEKTNKVDVYGDYLNSRKIKDDWGGLKVVFYHKPLSEILREIRDAKLELIDFLEPKAILSAKKLKPEFYEIHQKIPIFMIFELQRRDV